MPDQQRDHEDYRRGVRRDWKQRAHDERRAWGRGEEYGFAGRGPKDYQRPDDRIREDICDRMTDDDSLDASDISVQVKQGEVTLTGTVRTRDQKRRADILAESSSGVRGVINSICVSGESRLELRIGGSSVPS